MSTLSLGTPCDDAAVLYALSGLPPTDLPSPDERERVWVALHEQWLEARRTAASPPVSTEPGILDGVHEVFRTWLGKGYDRDMLDVVLAAALGRWMRGDPLWLMIVGGSGDAKTETIRTLAAVGAFVVGAISSEGALLNGLGKKDKDEDGTGGLLREIGSEGILVIQDATSLISKSRDARSGVMGAFREIYDGHWERPVGGGGGRREVWNGRLITIAAITTVWDTADREVRAAMGDRFPVIRLGDDSEERRREVGRSAAAASGHEDQMRLELSMAVKLLFERVPTGPDGKVRLIPISDEEQERLLNVASLVTRCRTGVDYNYHGSAVIHAHTPELPTRFLKQLIQVFRALLALGRSRHDAMEVTLRVAGDSMPPARLKVLKDVAKHGPSSVSKVRKRLGLSEMLVKRELDALHNLGALHQDSEEAWSGGKYQKATYRLAPCAEGNELLPAASPKAKES